MFSHLLIFKIPQLKHLLITSTYVFLMEFYCKILQRVAYAAAAAIHVKVTPVEEKSVGWNFCQKVHPTHEHFLSVVPHFWPI